MKRKPPKRPSAEPTRQAILLASQKLFAKKGFAATSISQIAKAAKINQSLIYHHFLSKERLWMAVKKNVLDQFSEKSGIVFEEAIAKADPKAMIVLIVKFRFEIYDNFPDLRRIVDWQFLESDPYELRGIDASILTDLEQRIADFQKNKKIINTYRADMILLYIFHVPVGFFKGYKNMQKVVEKNELEKLKEDYVALCIDSLCKTLII